MSERKVREVKPGYYVYEYSEEEIREITEELPEGLEFLEEHLSPPEPRGPFERFWTWLFS